MFDLKEMLTTTVIQGFLQLQQTGDAPALMAAADPDESLTPLERSGQQGSNGSATRTDTLTLAGPAAASLIILTMAADISGFFAVLGIATILPGMLSRARFRHVFCKRHGCA
jgi:hypothetical protein